MQNLVIGFAQNLTLPLAIVFCYAGLLRVRERNQTWARLASGPLARGVLFGAGAILCMLMPLPIAPGISIDNRIATVALAGPFAGPLGTIVATIIAGAYRGSLGGVGMWPGIASLVSAGLLGIAFGRQWPVAKGRFTVLHCLLLGLGTVAVSLPWTWTLPESVDPWKIFHAFALPVTVMYPFASVVLGGLLLQAIYHHRLANDLTNSEMRFRSLFTQAPDAIFIADPDNGLIIDANPQASNLLQRPRTVIIGMHQSKLHPPEDHDAVRALFALHYRESMAGRGVTPVQARILRSDGAAIPTEIVANLMDLAGRKVLVAIFRDLRERERATRAIAAAQALTERIIKTADACILGLDAKGRIVLFNPALERLSGYAAEMVLGQDWQETLIPRTHLLQTAEEFRSLLSSGSPRAIEGGLMAKDGTCPVVSWRCNVVDDPTVDARVIAVGIDVSVQRSMEDRIRHAEKMQAVGQLAGGLAHDFNNQLQIITGYTSLLAAGLAGDRGPEIIRNITEACTRASEVTGKLLAFSRKASVRRDAIDMTQLVRDATTLMKPALGSRIRIHGDLPNREIWVRGDASSLENALLNLVFNARDAMTDGGEIRIELDIDTPETTEMQARGFNLVIAPCCRLSVRDSGRGMSAEVLDRIFEPFFTTKPIGKGTGLGLAAVYGTVLEHGGAITVDSTPGSGSCFTLWIPLGQADPTPSGPGDGNPPQIPARPGPQTVLVVDDEDAIREMLSLALTSEGRPSQAFADGTSALAWFTVHGQSVALAIIDMHMPGLGGIPLTEALLAQNPALPIVISTGHGPDSLPAHLASHPGISLLSKPYQLSELAAHVRRRLG